MHERARCRHVPGMRLVTKPRDRWHRKSSSRHLAGSMSGNASHPVCQTSLLQPCRTRIWIGPLRCLDRKLSREPANFAGRTRAALQPDEEIPRGTLWSWQRKSPGSGEPPGLIDLVGGNDDLTRADPFQLNWPIASLQVHNHYLSGAAATKSRSPPKRMLIPMRATQI
jgi:hypothetical protein